MSIGDVVLRQEVKALVIVSTAITRSLFSDYRDYKKFPPEGLTKFAGFMKTIYSDPENNIYIYAFY